MVLGYRNGTKPSTYLTGHSQGTMMALKWVLLYEISVYRHSVK